MVVSIWYFFEYIVRLLELHASIAGDSEEKVNNKESANGGDSIADRQGLCSRSSMIEENE